MRQASEFDVTDQQQSSGHHCHKMNIFVRRGVYIKKPSHHYVHHYLGRLAENCSICIGHY